MYGRCSDYIWVKHFVIIIMFLYMFLSRRDKQLVGDIRKQFNMFYLEVLSSICFNRSSHNTGLERLLTDSVFKVKGTIYTTKPLWPYRSGGDRVPTIRSTLLQLLICHRYIQTLTIKLSSLLSQFFIN